MGSVNVKSLEKIDNSILEHLGIFIKLFILLYADNTVLFSETPEGLQSALDSFENYCKLWKLEVNVKKTKIVVFSKRKAKVDREFKIFDTVLDIEDSYSYLGLVFNYDGNFSQTKKKLVEQAHKALHGLYRKIRNVSIPVDLQVKLFDVLISPILLYGSEIWGFGNNSIIEKIHLQFCRKLLHVRTSTPSYMVYGELGRKPMDITIKSNMICYWGRLLQSDNKLSNILYRLMVKLSEHDNMQFNWINSIKSVLDDTGYSEFWIEQNSLHPVFMKKSVQQRLSDQFIQKWFSDMVNSPKGQLYSSIKSNFGFEPYLLKLSLPNRIYICKLRTCNLKLPIETGRWRKIPRDERYCTLCSDQLIGNEFHYLFICSNPTLNLLRSKYIPEYYTRIPTNVKMYGLLSHCNIPVLNRLALFIRKTSYLFT